MNDTTAVARRWPNASKALAGRLAYTLGFTMKPYTTTH